MSILKKLSLTAAASAAAFGLATASAAVQVSVNGQAPVANSATPATLEVGGTIEFSDNDLTEGQVLNETLSFVAGANVDTGDVLAAVQYGAGTAGRRAGIVNFMATFSVNGAVVAMSQITDATGRIDFDQANVILALSPGDLVEIALSGTVFEFPGFNATYRVGVLGDGNAIPVPAAGLLFGTAVVGAAAARRRRKLA